MDKSVSGYIGTACAVLFFGSNFIPIKKYETGDGMFFQFVVCCGIWVAGLIVTMVRDIHLFDFLAMLGGVIWATGNLCTVPVVKCIGLARGLLVWGITSMIVGWIVSYFGLLGQDSGKDAIHILWLNILGLVLCAATVIISSFIKSNDDDGEEPKRVTSVGNLAVVSTKEIIEDPLLPYNKATDNDSWEKKLSNKQKMIVGYGLAIFAGLMYGTNFSPCNAALKNYTGVDKMDMLFSQFCGILLASFVYLCIYCLVKKNKPAVYPSALFPGFLSGMMWGIAQTGWFYANAGLGEVISFPIVNCGPTIVSSLWSVFLYKEITGKKNYLILSAVIAVMIIGSICICLSNAL
ncbi:hypothetical protein WA158_006642 [Blastocystis sp. Blastoise]